MARRVLQVVALGVAVVLAVVAGRLVRHHVEGPDPVASVKAATGAAQDRHRPEGDRLRRRRGRTRRLP